MTWIVIISINGYLLNSAWDRMILSAHWFFLVINVFLFSVASGTILSFNYYGQVSLLTIYNDVVDGGGGVGRATHAFGHK